MLELDHIFCMVSDLERAADRLERDGWALDAGSEHRGQGTRNRRLVWTEQYLELLHVANPVEARANPLRLDRRADWSSAGASPFGFGLRGQLPDAFRHHFWLYEDLGLPIWVHHDNERAPERPLVFVLETAQADLERRRSRSRGPEQVERAPSATLREVRVHGPSPASVPSFVGPPITSAPGPHHLELVVGRGPARAVTQILSIRA